MEFFANLTEEKTDRDNHIWIQLVLGKHHDRDIIIIKCTFLSTFSIKIIFQPETSNQGDKSTKDKPKGLSRGRNSRVRPNLIPSLFYNFLPPQVVRLWQTITWKSANKQPDPKQQKLEEFLKFEVGKKWQCDCTISSPHTPDIKIVLFLITFFSSGFCWITNRSITWQSLTSWCHSLRRWASPSNSDIVIETELQK